MLITAGRVLGGDICTLRADQASSKASSPAAEECGSSGTRQKVKRVQEGVPLARKSNFWRYEDGDRMYDNGRFAPIIC